jgi:glutamine amidotransferase
MITIVHCGIGNIQSVLNALGSLGHAAAVAETPADLAGADRIILPGVGSFRQSAEKLRADGWKDALDELVLGRKLPVLGICLGMQLIAEWGDEHGGAAGLGWIEGRVQLIPRTTTDLRLPHVGWNDIEILRDSPLFQGLGDERSAYFVHSFQFVTSRDEDRAAVTDYGRPVTAAVAKGNVFGVQFHPEKSHRVGLAILDNFARMQGPC